MISLIHDPCMKYKEPGGVMSDTTTALRDPIFYRWHKMCDDLGVKLKNRLPRYTDADLTFSGIKIKSFDFVDPSDKVLPQLTTFWQRSIVNLQNGLDFHANVPSLVAFTHLNYQQFTYLWVFFRIWQICSIQHCICIIEFQIIHHFRLKVENTTDAAVQGTVRIFFQPVHDEKGERYLFEGSRSKAVEVDRFLINRESEFNIFEKKKKMDSIFKCVYFLLKNAQFHRDLAKRSANQANRQWRSHSNEHIPCRKTIPCCWWVNFVSFWINYSNWAVISALYLMWYIIM